MPEHYLPKYISSQTEEKQIAKKFIITYEDNSIIHIDKDKDIFLKFDKKNMVLLLYKDDEKILTIDIKDYL